MSATLLRLRKLLQDPVLVRTGRTMVPTPLAESLVEPIRDALAQIDRLLVERPDFDPHRDSWTFSVMASEYATLALLQPLLVELRATAPNVDLRLSPMSATFLEDLQHRHLDVLVTPPQAAPPGSPWSVQDLYRDPYVVAVDQGHPAVTDTISLEQFTSLPHLAVKTGSPILIETQLDELGIQRRTVVTSDFAWAPFLLRGTLLTTVVPRSYAARLAPGLGLKLLPPPMDLQPLTEAMIWNPQHDHEPAHRWLREQLTGFAARLEGRTG
jgi:DNA-binding transcriptional LysR family regulator